MPCLKRFMLAGTLAFAVSLGTAIDISVSSTGGNATNGHQYGFLHEDINNSGDGGLYAELIRNRAFQISERFPATLDAWHPVNDAKLSLKNLSTPLSDVLVTSMNVATGTKQGEVGFRNDGYWGMDVKAGKKYSGSFWVSGAYSGQFTASLQSNITGETFGTVSIPSQSSRDQWIEHDFEITPFKDAPNSNNTFVLTFDASGVGNSSLDFNLISLFPPTYNGRKNGMRSDIAEALEQLHPTLFRIPGGNMLEGLSNRTWWDWKNTLGPLKNRPGFSGVWGYQQTNGLGLVEYLEFAEDLGMEVVLAVYDGLALNGDITPQSELRAFVDDALDQIEFICGPTDSKWGSVRAELGHPEPWNLQYVEIGNEDWLAGAPQGWETFREYRFPMFLDAINKSYPDIQVISSGSYFDGYNIPEPAGGDYHVYAEPDKLVFEFSKFDNLMTPHLIGEMAAIHPNGGTGWNGSQQPFPWWIGAIGEAVSLIGYERNADRIIGASYAPIIRNMNRWQWPITMIQFTADTVTRSTSWYVWELLAAHPLTETLPATSDFGPLYYVAGKNDRTGGRIFKAAVYNSTDGIDVPVKLSFEGVAPGTAGELTILTGPTDPYGINSPYTGVNVVKTNKKTVQADKNGTFQFALPNLSVAVLDTSAPLVD
ncbi:glycoside hydrolase family 51 protein [Annulohypoxylon maeteangense]|uniref:glycoside hydrolase family 51 protein n=1 Tax=Annulohypoxylon maeteangense TaxID=1927788 RepID=UPI002008E453|nr:glycoside hydrolase family 51 protein [Annulohypoxylon maeteangense]KAI0879797.1 glycoside hydrolase family 51 protein [Annulohypoxylon maeteangense]